MEKSETSLESLTSEGRKLFDKDGATRAHSYFGYWDSSVAEWLDENYSGSGLSAKWSALPSSSLVIGNHYYDEPESWIAYRAAVKERLTFLSNLGKQMGMIEEQIVEVESSNRVFVVHGHDDVVREKVARFLEKLSLEPIILHEQPNNGRTIIEKFTDYSDVSYAVVLFTADDIGGSKATPKEELNSRARQNVIFELGYFIGRLGREKVCALHESGVEILSDYQGVLYLNLDPSDVWRFSLAKELQAAGLPVDMNKAV